jgi:uncharacterized protein
MSNLKNTILDDVKQAMRDKDKNKLNILRLLSAAIKQKEVDERPEDGLDDNAVIQIINTMIKQRRESANQYREGQREDLAIIEEAEIAIYEQYLPEPLSDEDIANLIDEALASTGASDLKGMGQVMNALRPKMLGRADMGQVSQLIKAKLTHPS